MFFMRAQLLNVSHLTLSNRFRGHVDVFFTCSGVPSAELGECVPGPCRRQKHSPVLDRSCGGCALCLN